jgi:yersiniabactin nonribosomal peptide synthetase
MTFTLDDMRRDIAEHLTEPGGAPPRVGDDADLQGLGMDSIMVMRLAARWREHGVRLSFGELIECTSLGQWWTLAATQLGTGAPVAPAAAEVDESAPFALATMQHAYWVGRSDDQALGGVGAHFYAELDGHGVDPARLEPAVRALFARHGMLRARFRDDGTQQIMPAPAWSGLVVHDLRETEPDAHLAAVRDRLSHRRLDVGGGEVFDVELSLLPGGATRLHVQIEMMVSDAQSFRVLLSDLARLYEAPDEPLPEVGYSFPRYLADLAIARADAREQAAKYWQDRVTELPDAPGLPLALDPEAVTGHRVSRRFHWLSPENVSPLADRCKAEGVTLTTLFLTAFAEVLATWSGQSRFLLNLPVYDRENLHPGVAGLVGDFVSLVLLEVDRGESFLDTARSVQRRLRSDVAHSAYPGLDVLRDLSRDRGRPVLAPVVFTSAYNLGELFDDTVRGVLGEPVWTMSQNPQVWLDFQVTSRDGGLYLNWDTVEDLFRPGVVDGMFEAYGRLLDWLTTGDWSGATPDLLPAATREVRAQVNDTAGFAPDVALHKGFWDVVAHEPDRIALIHGGEEVTYRALADSALRVAGALRQHGAREGDLVAVSLPKGIAQIEAVLGVLTAGCGYVPVGADQPAVRRDRICAGAGVRLLVGEPVGLPDVTAVEVKDASPAEAPVFADPGSLAYVIYTSGSTGEPKGVELTHAAAMNTIADINSRFGVTGDDRVLAVSALDFDLSVYDIFGLLSAGGALVLIDEEDRREAHRWADLVRQHGVTVWNTVPVLLDMLLVAAGGPLPGLRLGMVSGDWVGLDLPGRYAAQCGGRFIAMGGATEGAIWSNAYEVAGPSPEWWRSVPYGFPLRNQCYRVVDGNGRDCPDWVAGELWIGGAGVAEGYRGDPVRTAEKFVSHAGRRWYRTGDLGRYWSDGTLEFLGRADFQVKVRGHRIELGEIEAALRAHPAVTDAVAVAVGNPRRLAAAVAAETGPSSEELTRFAAERLPGYMVPERVAVVPAFPLSANGKVDRKAVVELLTAQAPARRAEPPAGPVETAVAEIWAELLDGGPVTRDANFFTLGGDSLHATRLLAAMAERGLRGATLRSLFEAPVLADFARTLTLGAVSAPRAQLTADPARRHEPFPATDVQRAYLLGRGDGYDLGGVGSHWYWEFDGADLDLVRLEDALNTLVVRHDMLRAVFDRDGNQRVLPEVPRLCIQVASHGPEVSDSQRLDQLRENTSHRISDPYQWPQILVAACRYGGNRTRLAFSFDFIVLDALSIMTLLTELAELYRDPGASLAPLGIGFRDYVLGHVVDSAERTAAEEYWLSQVDTLPAAPRLPLRMDPAELAAPQFTRRELRIAPDRWAAITAQARAHGLTPISVLATAYAQVLATWSGSPDLTLNLTLFDRRDVHPDIDAVLGDFTSLLLVPYRQGSGESFASAARRLQGDVWSGMEHRAVSAIWVLREMARRRRSAAVGMPVVLTSALGLPGGLGELDFGFGEPVWGTSQTPQVWLDFQVTERAGGLFVNWDAVEELFCAGALDGMFAAYSSLLETLAAPDADWSTGQPCPAPPDFPDRVTLASPVAPTAVDVALRDEAPVSGTERTLARLWAELLDVPVVGRGRGFFELGGDSLQATRLLDRVRGEFGVHMALRELVTAGTVAEMAAAVDAACADQADYEEGSL